MAAPIGFDPGRSLLPEGGGAIRAMSGGGGSPPPDYNSGQSLLARGPDVPIQAFRGGATGPAADPVAGSTASSDPVAGSTASSDPVAGSTASATSSSASVTSSTDPSASKPSSTSSVTSSTSSVNDPSASKPSSTSSVTSSTSSVNDPSASKPSSNDPVTSSSASVTSSTSSVTPTPTVVPVTEPSQTVTRTFLGRTYRLPPFDNKNPDTVKVLLTMGLNTANQDTKRAVIEALRSDEMCDMSKPLSMTSTCKPLRVILQALALNALERGDREVQREEHGMLEEEDDEHMLPVGIRSENADKIQGLYQAVREAEENVNILDEEMIAACGIPNLGSSCYCSAVVQMLFSVPSFRYSVIRATNLSEHPVPLALQKLFIKLSKQMVSFDNLSSFDSSRCRLTAGDEDMQTIMATFISESEGRSARSYQDAGELYGYMMEKCHEASLNMELFAFETKTGETCEEAPKSVAESTSTASTSTESTSTASTSTASTSTASTQTNRTPEDRLKNFLTDPTITKFLSKISATQASKQLRRTSRTPKVVPRSKKRGGANSDYQLHLHADSGTTLRSQVTAYSAPRQTDPTENCKAPRVHSETDTFTIPETNHYMVFHLTPGLTNAVRVNKMLTLGDKPYRLFGVVLFGGSHYTFERVRTKNIETAGESELMDDPKGVTRVLYDDDTVSLSTRPYSAMKTSFPSLVMYVSDAARVEQAEELSKVKAAREAAKTERDGAVRASVEAKTKAEAEAEAARVEAEAAQKAFLAAEAAAEIDAEKAEKARKTGVPLKELLKKVNQEQAWVGQMKVEEAQNAKQPVKITLHALTWIFHKLNITERPAASSTITQAYTTYETDCKHADIECQHTLKLMKPYYEELIKNYANYTNLISEYFDSQQQMAEVVEMMSSSSSSSIINPHISSSSNDASISPIKSISSSSSSTEQKSAPEENYEADPNIAAYQQQVNERLAGMQTFQAEPDEVPDIQERQEEHNNIIERVKGITERVNEYRGKLFSEEQSKYDRDALEKEVQDALKAIDEDMKDIHTTLSAVKAELKKVTAAWQEYNAVDRFLREGEEEVKTKGPHYNDIREAARQRLDPMRERWTSHKESLNDVEEALKPMIENELQSSYQLSLLLQRLLVDTDVLKQEDDYVEELKTKSNMDEYVGKTIPNILGNNTAYKTARETIDELMEQKSSQNRFTNLGTMLDAVQKAKKAFTEIITPLREKINAFLALLDEEEKSNAARETETSGTSGSITIMPEIRENRQKVREDLKREFEISQSQINIEETTLHAILGDYEKERRRRDFAIIDEAGLANRITGIVLSADSFDKDTSKEDLIGLSSRMILEGNRLIGHTEGKRTISGVCDQKINELLPQNIEEKDPSEHKVNMEANYKKINQYLEVMERMIADTRIVYDKISSLGRSNVKESVDELYTSIRQWDTIQKEAFNKVQEAFKKANYFPLAAEQKLYTATGEENKRRSTEGKWDVFDRMAKLIRDRIEPRVERAFEAFKTGMTPENYKVFLDALRVWSNNIEMLRLMIDHMDASMGRTDRFETFIESAEEGMVGYGTTLQRLGSAMDSIDKNLSMYANALSDIRDKKVKSTIRRFNQPRPFTTDDAYEKEILDILNTSYPAANTDYMGVIDKITQKITEVNPTPSEERSRKQLSYSTWRNELKEATKEYRLQLELRKEIIKVIQFRMDTDVVRNMNATGVSITHALADSRDATRKKVYKELEELRAEFAREDAEVEAKEHELIDRLNQIEKEVFTQDEALIALIKENKDTGYFLKPKLERLIARLHKEIETRKDRYDLVIFLMQHLFTMVDPVLDEEEQTKLRDTLGDLLDSMEEMDEINKEYKEKQYGTKGNPEPLTITLKLRELPKKINNTFAGLEKTKAEILKRVADPIRHIQQALIPIQQYVTKISELHKESQEKIASKTNPDDVKVGEAIRNLITPHQIMENHAKIDAAIKVLRENMDTNPGNIEEPIIGPLMANIRYHRDTIAAVNGGQLKSKSPKVKDEVTKHLQELKQICDAAEAASKELDAAVKELLQSKPAAPIALGNIKVGLQAQPPQENDSNRAKARAFLDYLRSLQPVNRSTFASAASSADEFITIMLPDDKMIRIEMTDHEVQDMKPIYEAQEQKYQDNEELSEAERNELLAFFTEQASEQEQEIVRKAVQVYGYLTQIQNYLAAHSDKGGIYPPQAVVPLGLSSPFSLQRQGTSLQRQGTSLALTRTRSLLSAKEIAYDDLEQKSDADLLTLLKEQYQALFGEAMTSATAKKLNAESAKMIAKMEELGISDDLRRVYKDDILAPIKQIGTDIVQPLDVSSDTIYHQLWSVLTALQTYQSLFDALYAMGTRTSENMEAHRNKTDSLVAMTELLTEKISPPSDKPMGWLYEYYKDIYRRLGDQSILQQTAADFPDRVTGLLIDGQDNSQVEDVFTQRVTNGAFGTYLDQMIAFFDEVLKKYPLTKGSKKDNASLYAIIVRLKADAETLRQMMTVKQISPLVTSSQSTVSESSAAAAVPITDEKTAELIDLHLEVFQQLFRERLIRDIKTYLTTHSDKPLIDEFLYTYLSDPSDVYDTIMRATLTESGGLQIVPSVKEDTYNQVLIDVVSGFLSSVNNITQLHDKLMTEYIQSMPIIQEKMGKLMEWAKTQSHTELNKHYQDVIQHLQKHRGIHQNASKESSSTPLNRTTLIQTLQQPTYDVSSLSPYLSALPQMMKDEQTAISTSAHEEVVRFASQLLEGGSTRENININAFQLNVVEESPVHNYEMSPLYLMMNQLQARIQSFPASMDPLQAANRTEHESDRKMITELQTPANHEVLRDSVFMLNVMDTLAKPTISRDLSTVNNIVSHMPKHNNEKKRSTYAFYTTIQDIYKQAVTQIDRYQALFQHIVDQGKLRKTELIHTYSKILNSISITPFIYKTLTRFMVVYVNKLLERMSQIRTDYDNITHKLLPSYLFGKGNYERYQTNNNIRKLTERVKNREEMNRYYHLQIQRYVLDIYLTCTESVKEKSLTYSTDLERKFKTLFEIPKNAKPVLPILSMSSSAELESKIDAIEEKLNDTKKTLSPMPPSPPPPPTTKHPMQEMLNTISDKYQSVIVAQTNDELRAQLAQYATLNANLEKNIKALQNASRKKAAQTFIKKIQMLTEKLQEKQTRIRELQAKPNVAATTASSSSIAQPLGNIVQTTTPPSEKLFVQSIVGQPKSSAAPGVDEKTNIDVWRSLLTDSIQLRIQHETYTQLLQEKARLSTQIEDLARRIRKNSRLEALRKKDIQFMQMHAASRDRLETALKEIETNYRALYDSLAATFRNHISNAFSVNDLQTLITTICTPFQQDKQAKMARRQEDQAALDDLMEKIRQKEEEVINKLQTILEKQTSSGLSVFGFTIREEKVDKPSNTNRQQMNADLDQILSELSQLITQYNTVYQEKGVRVMEEQATLTIYESFCSIDAGRLKEYIEATLRDHASLPSAEPNNKMSFATKVTIELPKAAVPLKGFNTYLSFAKSSTQPINKSQVNNLQVKINEVKDQLSNLPELPEVSEIVETSSRIIERLEKEAKKEVERFIRDRPDRPIKEVLEEGFNHFHGRDVRNANENVNDTASKIYDLCHDLLEEYEKMAWPYISVTSKIESMMGLMMDNKASANQLVIENSTNEEVRKAFKTFSILYQLLKDATSSEKKPLFIKQLQAEKDAAQEKRRKEEEQEAIHQAREMNLERLLDSTIEVIQQSIQSYNPSVKEHNVISSSAKFTSERNALKENLQGLRTLIDNTKRQQSRDEEIDHDAFSHACSEWLAGAMNSVKALDNVVNRMEAILGDSFTEIRADVNLLFTNVQTLYLQQGNLVLAVQSLTRNEAVANVKRVNNAKAEKNAAEQRAREEKEEAERAEREEKEAAERAEQERIKQERQAEEQRQMKAANNARQAQLKAEKEEKQRQEQLEKEAEQQRVINSIRAEDRKVTELSQALRNRTKNVNTEKQIELSAMVQSQKGKTQKNKQNSKKRYNDAIQSRMAAEGAVSELRVKLGDAKQRAYQAKKTLYDTDREQYVKAFGEKPPVAPRSNVLEVVAPLVKENQGKKQPTRKANTSATSTPVGFAPASNQSSLSMRMTPKKNNKGPSVSSSPRSSSAAFTPVSGSKKAERAVMAPQPSIGSPGSFGILGEYAQKVKNAPKSSASSKPTIQQAKPVIEHEVVQSKQPQPTYRQGVVGLTSGVPKTQSTSKTAPVSQASSTLSSTTAPVNNRVRRSIQGPSTESSSSSKPKSISNVRAQQKKERELTQAAKKIQEQAKEKSQAPPIGFGSSEPNIQSSAIASTPAATRILGQTTFNPAENGRRRREEAEQRAAQEQKLQNALEGRGNIKLSSRSEKNVFGSSEPNTESSAVTSTGYATKRIVPGVRKIGFRTGENLKKKLNALSSSALSSQSPSTPTISPSSGIYTKNNGTRAFKLEYTKPNQQGGKRRRTRKLKRHNA